MSLHTCVDDNAVIRPGHKPFHRTIGEALDQLARRSESDAWLRDMLEDMRKDRPARNSQVGGKCENCGKEGWLTVVKQYDGTDMVTFAVCRTCRP